jgi:hypothetical protein
MREIRTYGSEGGEAGEPAFPTPITGQILDAETAIIDRLSGGG